MNVEINAKQLYEQPYLSKVALHRIQKASPLSTISSLKGNTVVFVPLHQARRYRPYLYQVSRMSPHCSENRFPRELLV